MRTPKLIFKLGFLFLILTAFQCDDEADEQTCEEKTAQLTSLKTTIEELADASVCNDDSECRYIAFGSKPCGGPWSYLVYSTSIDTTKLTQLVEKYNSLESKINQDCERFSDCAMVNPPQRLECKDNTCVAIYQ